MAKEGQDITMFELWRNSEFKKCVIRFLILFGGMLLILSLLLGIFYNEVKKGIIEQDAAIAGTILTRHPELEQEVVSSLRNRATESQMNIGFSILSRYGLNKSLLIDRTPILQNLIGNAIFTIVLFMLLFFMIVLW